MSQTSEMGMKRGAKKPSGQMPPEQGPAPSASPSAGPTHSGPVVVDLDSSPVSRKRKADIPPDDLEQLSRAAGMNPALHLVPNPQALSHLPQFNHSALFGQVPIRRSTLLQLRRLTARPGNLLVPTPEVPNYAQLFPFSSISVGRKELGSRCFGPE